jgi:hypothetical protein
VYCLKKLSNVLKTKATAAFFWLTENLWVTLSAKQQILIVPRSATLHALGEIHEKVAISQGRQGASPHQKANVGGKLQRYTNAGSLLL